MGARGLAEDRDAVGVAAELFDVALHPSEYSNLVLHAEIAAEFRARKVAEGAQSVVEADDGGATCGQLRTIGAVLAAPTTQVAAAVDPDHHRLSRLTVQGAGPHVEVEAVLALARGARREDGAGGLGADRAKLRRLPGPGPFGRWNGRSPA